MNSARAFAPSSVANVAVGFDLLGFSIGVAGDKVLVEKTASPEIKIESISGITTQITLDPIKNTATAGLIHLQKDLNLKFGFKVSIEKGISLGSGMGGSAASAVAAILAANALLESPLSQEKLMNYALIGESQASGSFHADNISPCLIGGLVLSRIRKTQNSLLPLVEITSIPLPKNIHCVLVHPQLAIETKQARSILKTEVAMSTFVEQSANIAGFVAGCFTNDLKLISRSFADLIVEPQRSHLIPGFFEVQTAAMSLGALGCSISGAGPSVFAWAAQKSAADEIKLAMLAAFRKVGVQAEGWAVPLDQRGAHLIS